MALGARGDQTAPSRNPLAAQRGARLPYHGIEVAGRGLTFFLGRAGGKTTAQTSNLAVRMPSAREPGDLYHLPGRTTLRGQHREGTRQSR